MFPFKKDDPEGFTLLSPFKADSDYFGPSDKPFMVNLRVDDLDGVIADLEGKGIEILGRQDEDYGRFAWILDPDGVKVELWQQLGPAPSKLSASPDCLLGANALIICPMKLLTRAMSR